MRKGFKIALVLTPVVILLGWWSVSYWASISFYSNKKEIKRLTGGQSTSTDITPVLMELKDPESAQFRNVANYGGIVCGEVNAKNSFGGYTGYKKFMVTDDEVAFFPEEAFPKGSPSMDTYDLLCGGLER